RLERMPNVIRGGAAGRSWASISGAPGLPANQRLILKHSRTRYLRAANSVSPTKKRETRADERRPHGRAVFLLLGASRSCCRQCSKKTGPAGSRLVRQR